jgi:hypothetical protein
VVVGIAVVAEEGRLGVVVDKCLVGLGKAVVVEEDSIERVWSWLAVERREEVRSVAGLWSGE